MNSLDPPRHTAMRALIARGFTPRRVDEPGLLGDAVDEVLRIASPTYTPRTAALHVEHVRRMGIAALRRHRVIGPSRV